MLTCLPEEAGRNGGRGSYFGSLGLVPGSFTSVGLKLLLNPGGLGQSFGGGPEEDYRTHPGVLRRLSALDPFGCVFLRNSARSEPFAWT